MAEQYDLTAPVTPPTVTNYKIREFYLRYAPPNQSEYWAVVLSNTAEPLRYAVMDTPANSNLATTRLKALNTANLTSNSLQRRLLNFAGQDGALPPGTVSGTPDP